MSTYAVDRVSEGDKEEMRDVLRSMEEDVSVSDIVRREDNSFESKEEVVSVLHALVGEGSVSHNINREYRLTA